LKPISNATKGALFCIFSGLFYCPIGYFGMSIMHENISISNMLFWRYFISTIFTFLILLPNITVLNISYKELWKPLLIGMVCYGNFSYLYFLSSKYIGSGLAMVIFFIYPAIVMIFNKVFHNHSIGIIYYFSISIIILGLAFLIDLDCAKFDLYGISLSLITAVGYAIYIVLSKKQMPHIAPLVSTLMVSMGSSIVCLLITLSDGSFIVPVQSAFWRNILGLSIISTALPTLFLLEGLKYIKSERASILSVLEPVGVFLLGVTVLKEHVTIMQTIGVIIILVGAMLVQLDRTGNDNRTA
jgi:drug/metabolite transporter (DMT)-like permease